MQWLWNFFKWCTQLKLTCTKEECKEIPIVLTWLHGHLHQDDTHKIEKSLNTFAISIHSTWISCECWGPAVQEKSECVFSRRFTIFFSLEDMQNQTLVLKLALERWNSKWLQSERHLNLQRRSVETCGAYSHVPRWHAQIEKSVALSFHLLTWTPCSVEFRETPFGTKQIAAFLSESLQSWDDTHISEV